MYCVKCRKVTDTINITNKISKNNRNMKQGNCSLCGTKKTQFVGKGIFNKALNTVGNIVGEMHIPADVGEHVPNGSFNNLKKYSFCGPGTKYEQRVKEGYQGINALDQMCKLHDKFYNEHKDTKSRNISDYILAKRAEEIANDPNFDEKQRWWADKVRLIMQTKAKFGLGINSKNVKKGPVTK